MTPTTCPDCACVFCGAELMPGDVIACAADRKRLDETDITRDRAQKRAWGFRRPAADRPAAPPRGTPGMGARE